MMARSSLAQRLAQEKRIEKERKDEQLIAWRAAQRFNQLLPQLRSFIQAAAGRPIKIEVAAGGSKTDGNKIFLSPPFELGYDLTHQPENCDKVAPDGIPLCAACGVREGILTNLYHEVSHLVFNSYGGTTAKINPAKVRAAGLAMPRATDLLGKVPMSASIFFDPYMPLLLNFIEDIRVDRAMYSIRPGLERMALVNDQMIVDGTKLDSNGKALAWKDAPLDPQAMAFFYFTAKYGQPPAGAFSDVLYVDLSDDKELMELADKTIKVKDVNESFDLAMQVLKRFRDLGYMHLPDTFKPQPEPEPEPEPEQEQESHESGPNLSGLNKPGAEGSDDQSEGGDQSGDSGSGDDPEGSGAEDVPRGDSGSGGGAESESSEEQSSGTHSPNDGDSVGSDGSDADSEQDDKSAHGGGEDLSSSDPSDPDGDNESTRAVGPGDTEVHDASEEDGGLSVSDQGAGTDDLLRPHGPADDHGTDTPEPTPDPSADDDGPPSGERRTIDAPPQPKPSSYKEYKEKHGNVADSARAAREIIGHNAGPTNDTPAHNDAMETAVRQQSDFEEASVNILGVTEYRPSPEGGWSSIGNARVGARALPYEWKPAPSVLGRALMKTRKYFEDNARSKYETNLNRGRVNTRSLGRRAWSGDDRLFQKRNIERKKDYVVAIGVDVSGSTKGHRLSAELKAVYTQAELFSRVGITFGIFAHSGANERTASGNFGAALAVQIVKDFKEPWGLHTKNSLANLYARGANLDGHALEYLRRSVERRPEEDKLVMYFSDGAMPNSNHDEELRILYREMAHCKKRNIGLAAVGIHSNDPQERYGIPMVLVRDESDILAVADHVAISLGAG